MRPLSLSLISIPVSLSSPAQNWDTKSPHTHTHPKCFLLFWGEKKGKFRLKKRPPLPWSCHTTLTYRKPNVSVKGQPWIFKALYLAQADIKSITSGTKSGREGELEYATGPATARLFRGSSQEGRGKPKSVSRCWFLARLPSSLGNHSPVSCLLQGSMTNRARDGNERDSSCPGVTAADGELVWEVISWSAPWMWSRGCLLTSPGYPSSGLKPLGLEKKAEILLSRPS